MRIPFVLKNDPATFQCAMNILLESKIATRTGIYRQHHHFLQGARKSTEAHSWNVIIIFEGHRGNQTKNCHFYRKSIDYLRQATTFGKLQVALETIEAVVTVQHPTNIVKVRSFLVLYSVHRRFVANFGSLAAPLNKRVKKVEHSQLGLDFMERKAVGKLKVKLLTPPELTLPQRDGQHTVEPDACKTQLKCVRLQEQKGKTLKPMRYWSRSLRDAETRYEPSHNECLPVVWTILRVCLYTESTLFVARTDHASLDRILNLNKFTDRLARWQVQLMQFDFEVVLCPGTHLLAADAVPRLPKAFVGNGRESKADVNNDVLTYCIAKQVLEA